MSPTDRSAPDRALDPPAGGGRPPWTLRSRLWSRRSRPSSAPVDGRRSCAVSGSVTRVHPILTDLVLGSWTSATVLDLFGGEESSAGAQRLVGTGLLAVGPTAWTGWAEWTTTGPRDKRVGLVHAVTNGTAVGVYAASWVARRQGRHDSGARLALVGAAVSGLGAYLGGHLAAGRGVATRHPAYVDTPAG